MLKYLNAFTSNDVVARDLLSAVRLLGDHAMKW